METLSVGDVVRLNSGGAAMTVEAIEEAVITCVWFASGIVRRDNFARALLTKITGIGSPQVF